MTDELAVRDPVDLTEWRELMPDIDAVIVEDPDAIALEIAKRILSATTADDVLAPQQTTPAEDVLGVPVEVRGVRWNPSAYNGGPGAYAVIDAVRVDTGEVLAISCGSRNVIVQLYRLVKLGALPRQVVIVRVSKPTSSGYYPMWLQRVDA
jgi:hypothetical protein